MTDDEILEFMGWHEAARQWLDDGKSSLWGRVKLIVLEAQRLERERLLGDKADPCALLRPRDS